MHACKFCALSTCLGHLQILVLGFCDNQRDEELIWKILSQVLSAACFMHIFGGISMPNTSRFVTVTTSAACSVRVFGAISMNVICHFVVDGKCFKACFVHDFEAISMTVMHHGVSDGATEWWSG